MQHLPFREVEACDKNQPLKRRTRTPCNMQNGQQPKGSTCESDSAYPVRLPDLLRFKEVDKPALKDDEVLIRVHATTVSTGDCNMRNFTFVTKSMLPMAKLMFGIGKP